MFPWSQTFIAVMGQHVAPSSVFKSVQKRQIIISLTKLFSLSMASLLFKFSVLFILFFCLKVIRFLHILFDTSLHGQDVFLKLEVFLLPIF